MAVSHRIDPADEGQQDQELPQIEAEDLLARGVFEMAGDHIDQDRDLRPVAAGLLELPLDIPGLQELFDGHVLQDAFAPADDDAAGNAELIEVQDGGLGHGGSRSLVVGKAREGGHGDGKPPRPWTIAVRRPRGRRRRRCGCRRCRPDSS
ncbi:hypothetical protein ABNQ39_35295 (plasmid) [Azospirillum sp. A26]|uniref:hypothetical protein n=1 Tax=Azospirillum sp. A26 TaxID=3160607 RepID=UPI00366B26AF